MTNDQFDRLLESVNGLTSELALIRVTMQDREIRMTRHMAAEVARRDRSDHERATREAARQARIREAEGRHDDPARPTPDNTVNQDELAIIRQAVAGLPVTPVVVSYDEASTVYSSEPPANPQPNPDNRNIQTDL